MNTLKQYFLVVSLFCFLLTNAQKGFHFKKQTQSSVKVPFKLIGNLMVLDVRLNDVPLSFILDTGANNTFLFNLSNTDSLELKNINKIKINGLGALQSTESVRSLNNKFQVGGLVNESQDVHLILDRGINFSSQLGIPIHGIIGCGIFKNYVVKINYSTKIIRFYKRDSFKYKKIRKYDKLDLFLNKKRMYVNSEVKVDNDHLIPVKLLLDTGSSDSVWLFESKERGINVPENKFRDYMGTGIGGSIHGERSRLKKISIANYEISEAKVSFPDSLDVALVYQNKNRHGSIGAGILKRFNAVFDYGSKALYLKKNRFFKEPFEYNMSGLEIEHNGLRVDRVFDGKIQFSEEAKESNNARQVSSINNLFKTSLVPVFQVMQVREASPAEKAGIMEGDILIKVNRKQTHRYQLSEIIEMLSKGDGESIQLEIERQGKKMRFDFELERLL